MHIEGGRVQHLLALLRRRLPVLRRRVRGASSLAASAIASAAHAATALSAEGATTVSEHRKLADRCGLGYRC